MKVLVCGSRDWQDRPAVEQAIMGLWASSDDLTIIEGGARGADTMARDTASALGVSVKTHSADWERHGKRAGILRNLAMLDEKPDLVLAFRRDGSRGTTHTINEARRRGIPVDVVEDGSRAA